MLLIGAMRWATVLGAITLAALACSVRQGERGEIASPQSWVRFEPGVAAPSAKERIAAVSGELDAYFNERLTTTAATGLAVGIIVDGELLYAKGLGAIGFEIFLTPSVPARIAMLVSHAPGTDSLTGTGGAICSP